MAARDALIRDVVTISPTTKIEDALALISDHGIRAVPVVDAKKKYHGLFGLPALLDELLPVAARIEGGLHDLGFVTGGAGGAAKRIRKLAPKSVKTVLHPVNENAVLSPDIPMLEVIRRLHEFGSPLPVVDEKGVFLGLVSEQSCLNRLKDVLKDVEKEEAEEEKKKKKK